MIRKHLCNLLFQHNVLLSLLVIVWLLWLGFLVMACGTLAVDVMRMLGL